MSNSETVIKFKNIQDEGFELFKQKNTDYGNAFEDCGAIGILVRMNDKIKRMQHITKTSITIINSESLRDTLIDLQNYATLAILELDRIELSKSNNIELDKINDAFNKLDY